MKLVIVGAVLLALLVPLALLAVPEADQDIEREIAEAEELLERLRQEAGRPPAGGRAAATARVVRVHDVSDLTFVLTDYRAPHLRLLAAGAEISDDAPRFGRSDEGEVFFASAEDVLELVEENVRPELWDQGRVTTQFLTRSAFAILAPAEVQEEITRWLEELRRSVGKLVTVEVRLLEFREGAPLPVGNAKRSRKDGLDLLERAKEGEGVRLLSSARITGMNGQRSALFAGGQRAFVQDYDAEVAQEAQIADPIVGILQEGLALDVRPLVRGENRVLLEIRADISRADGEMRTVETAGGPSQVPVQRFATIFTTVTVRDGEFALLAGGGNKAVRWALLVSPRIETVAAEPAKGGAE